MLVCVAVGCGRQGMEPSGAHIEATILSETKPEQMVLTCAADELRPPLKVRWQLTGLKQVGWLPPTTEPWIMVSPAAHGMVRAECTATDAGGRQASAARAFGPLSISSVVPSDLKPGTLIEVRGFGFSGDKELDAIYLAALDQDQVLPANGRCKRASFGENKLVVCAPPSIPAGRYELRVQSGGRLQRAKKILTVNP